MIFEAVNAAANLVPSPAYTAGPELGLRYLEQVTFIVKLRKPAF